MGAAATDVNGMVQSDTALTGVQCTEQQFGIANLSCRVLTSSVSYIYNLHKLQWSVNYLNTKLTALLEYLLAGVCFIRVVEQRSM